MRPVKRRTFPFDRVNAGSAACCHDLRG